MSEHYGGADEDRNWYPVGMLAFLAAGFVLCLALAAVIAATGGEIFAIGLAIYGAVVMVIGALLGFGPFRRV